MTQIVLILGASGRFGRHANAAFTAAGWQVRTFDRSQDDLIQAATGVDVIVNAWNPPYPDWAREMAGIHAQVRRAARVSDALVIIPGNVYVFGAQTPSPWGPKTPHAAKNPMGRLRIDMEAAYRSEGIRTLILRAGDFLDTEASGNWFDLILTKPLAKGVLSYPGKDTLAHAWAFLPDITRAAVALSEHRDKLPRFCDLSFSGYSLTGQELAQALSRVTGRSIRIKRMQWWPLRMMAPFWKTGACLVEMSYLWNTAHQLDQSAFDQILPEFKITSLESALAQAIPAQSIQRQVHPDQSMATSQ